MCTQLREAGVEIDDLAVGNYSYAGVLKLPSYERFRRVDLKCFPRATVRAATAVLPRASTQA